MAASLTGFAVLFSLLFLGVPLGFGLAFVGAVGFALLTDWGPAFAIVGQTAVDTVLSYGFSILPQFILMGAFLAHARLADDLYVASNAFLGHLRGGLALATIVACGGFSAVCGSSTATAATMTQVSVPQMRRFGYDPGFAAGTVAAGGSLGILIPPSTIMVIYGLITENDIGKLFVAGVLPGLLGVLLYLAAIAAVIRRRPELGPPGPRVEWPARRAALMRVWGVLLLFVIVIGGIYAGIFTANEAAGIGATGGFLFALARRSLTLRSLFGLLVDTARTVSMIFVVIIGALVFAKFITIAGLPSALAGWVEGLDAPPLAILGALLVVYLVLGCLFDALSMVFLTVPVFYPIIIGLGFDPIWFGVILVVAVEVSLITPPIGINVFMVKAMLPETPITAIYRGVAPFIVVDVLRLAILALLPGFVLFLPSFMG